MENRVRVSIRRKAQYADRCQPRSYTWGFENGLVQTAIHGSNGRTTTFKYDPFGRRIPKSGPPGTTNYLYDGDNSIEGLDQIGNVLARYAQGPVADEQLSELSSTSTGYHEGDGLGSITSLSNPAGTLATTYTYDPYGKLTASLGTLANPFHYTAREFDPETGIYYYRARYYDPTIGRFASEDPIQFRGGINFYDYVRNNPISRIDPLGLCPTPEYPKKPPCGNEAPMPPMPPTSQVPYPASYIYRGVSANWMYQLGGDNAWGNRVRSCLPCMYSQGVPADAAHAFCNANASNQVSTFDRDEGYAAAYSAAIMFFIQNNQGPPHGH